MRMVIPRSCSMISPSSLPWMSSRSSTKALRKRPMPAASMASITLARSSSPTVDTRSSRISIRVAPTAPPSAASIRHIAIEISTESVPSNT
jgi:hypothetical protein